MINRRQILLFLPGGRIPYFIYRHLMHNLTKIKVFRALLWLTYPLALLFIYPFALLKKKNSSPFFFFLDRYSIGGAQRIHLDILASISNIHKKLYFTRLSVDKNLKDVFYATPNAEIKDIHTWCDNLFFRLFTVHFYTFYVNRHKKAHVFSSNSTFFYDMLPFFSKHVIKTELLHNFTHGKNGMEFFGLANVRYLNYRIVYDNFTLANIKKQYEEYHVDPSMLERIRFIEPGVLIPSTPHKQFKYPLKVLYAGRGGPQKRIPLLDKIADHCLKQNNLLEFHFAGPMMDELSDYVKQHSVFHGQISRQEDMYALYNQCHIILMTSAYEGFPMLIKEGMACGCIPVVTDLVGNKTHLQHMKNGLLIDNFENEGDVVKNGIANLELLRNDLVLTEALSERAYKYAREHFDRENFLKAYRDFFLS